MTINGMDLEMKVDQAMEMSMHTKKVDAKGNAHVDARFDRVKMNMEGFTGVVEVDSKDDKEPDDQVGKILHQVVKALAAVDMTMTMDPTGEVTDLKMSEAALKKLKELPGADQGGFGSMTSEGTLKQMMQGGIVFPKNPVKKGDTWSRTTEAELPFGKMKAVTKHTYEGTEARGGKSLEKISFVPDIKLEPSADAPLKIEFKDVVSKGRALFDPEKGDIVEAVTETTMQISVEVGGMTITQNIIQETTVRPKSAK